MTAVTTAAVGLAGGYLLALAAVVGRRHDGPGVGAFAVFVALFGAGGVGGGGLLLSGRGELAGIWLLQCAELASIAWFVFAVRYTGRGALLTRRRLAGLVGVYAAIWPPAWATLQEGFVMVALLGVLTNLYGIVLTLAGATLLVQTTYRHGVLDTRVGLVLGVVAFVPWVFADWFALVGTSPSSPAWYAAGFLALGALLSVAVFRMDALAATAATLPLGRRALRSGTDDLIVVADGEDRIVEVNDTVARRLGVDPAAVGGTPVEAVLGAETADLRERDLLGLDTVDGRRQFDVQHVGLGDHGGRSLGHLLSLRDVTRRRQREQGLDVLNRVLRHNIRNEVSVIDGRATLLAERVDDPELAEHLRAVRESTDSLSSLSDKAASLQAVFDADGGELAPVDTVALVEAAARAVESAHPEADIRTPERDGVTVRTSERLVNLAVEEVIENAVVHVDAAEPTVEVSVRETPDGVRIRVDDEGDGVPAAERAVIEREAETDLDHGSGLGLWLANWAVTACGGTVAFGEHPGGGRVELRVPDREGAGAEKGE